MSSDDPISECSSGAEAPAVLLLIFNRPALAAKALAAIRAARPSRLYIAADGPRSRPGEAELCERAREVAKSVDWPCELLTLFREKNLGCREAVSSAISWFFQSEEEGIILEDDCIASPIFFPFCRDLLARYRNDTRVMCITGDNFQATMGDYPYTYYFSKYNHCWGWASWRRAWALYDQKLDTLDEFLRTDALSTMSSTEGFESYWSGIFQMVKERKIDSWAYVWTFSCWSQNGLTCTPRVNLVSNVGFGPEATHTVNSSGESPYPLTGVLSTPLVHPSAVAPQQIFDAYVDRSHFGIGRSPRRHLGFQSVAEATGRLLYRAARRGMMTLRSVALWRKNGDVQRSK